MTLHNNPLPILASLIPSYRSGNLIGFQSSITNGPFVSVIKVLDEEDIKLIQCDDEDEQFARVRLLRSPRCSMNTYKKLMAEHGSGVAGLVGLVDLAKSNGMHHYQPCQIDDAKAVIGYARDCGLLPPAADAPVKVGLSNQEKAVFLGRVISKMFDDDATKDELETAHGYGLELCQEQRSFSKEHKMFANQSETIAKVIAGASADDAAAAVFAA